MSEPTIWAPAYTIQTGFQNWKGSPPHLFGKFVGKPWQPWAFNEIYTETGLVIVRDDIFENTVGVPLSLKTHNPGQVISRFDTDSNYSRGQSNGVAFNIITNGIMNGVTIGAHSDFILGEKNYYNTWRMRGQDQTDGTWHVYAGEGVTPNGANITGMYAVGNPPYYVLAPDFVVGETAGTVKWQVEVGFGGSGNALATYAVTSATPEWPAYL